MNFLQSRVFRSGGYSALYVLVFVGILAAANWLGVQYNETYDATSCTACRIRPTRSSTTWIAT